jgi:hypothetical protein
VPFHRHGQVARSARAHRCTTPPAASARTHASWARIRRSRDVEPNNGAVKKQIDALLAARGKSKDVPHAAGRLQAGPMRKTKKGKVGSLSVMADGPEPSPAALNTHEATEEAAGHNVVSFHVADGTGGSTELRSLGATMFGSRTVLISSISPRSSPHSSEPALASASPAVLDTVAVVEAAALSAASGDSPNNVKCQSPAPNRELHSVSPPTPSTVASANKTPQLFCPLPADAAFASLGEKSCMSHIVESATPSPTLEPLSPEARSSKSS